MGFPFSIANDNYTLTKRKNMKMNEIINEIEEKTEEIISSEELLYVKNKENFVLIQNIVLLNSDVIINLA